MDTLFGKTLSELKQVCEQFSLPGFAAKQMADWLYKKGVTSISEMTNISLKSRAALSECYTIGLTEPVSVMVSKDGTKKYLYQYGERDFVEAVLIPDKDRATLCISTQVGCKMNCQFCATGRQGFSRNLSCNEILNIIRSLPEFSCLTNIVYMGMGEPLDNYDNVVRSIEILTSEWGFALSPHRITVSTSGYLSRLKDFLDQTKVHLAISLHNPVSQERERLMPIEKSYKIKDVVELLKQYDWKSQRRLTFEYIVFEGLNNQKRHVLALMRLLDGLFCRINLIKFHTIEGTPYIAASEQSMEKLRDTLSSKNTICTIRASRGEDILVACGLLSTKKILENGRNNTTVESK